MVAPRAVRAAERILASGSSANFSRTVVTASMCRRPARSINTSRPSPDADSSRAAKSTSISFAGRSARTLTAAAETSALASSAASRSTGPQEASPDFFSPRIEAIRSSPAPFLAAWSRASRALGSARSARARSTRARRGGGAWSSSASRAFVTSGAGNLPAQLQPQGEPLLVGRFQEIDEHWQPVRTAGDDRAADAFEHAVLGTSALLTRS